VKIKRLNYVEEVRKSVYARMIAERKQIVEKFRSEGKGEARKIEGDRERELKRITSEAYRKAQEIKGKADAEPTRIYAQAYSRDPDFYSFVTTLEIYKKTMGKDTSLILSTDSEFFKFFKEYKEKQPATTSEIEVLEEKTQRAVETAEQALQEALGAKAAVEDSAHISPEPQQ